MGCGDEKLSKSLTQTFTAHCNAMICQQVTLSGDAEWPKVADAVIEADQRTNRGHVPAYNPTTSLARVDQICPRRIAVLRSQATRKSAILREIGRAHV